MHGETDIDVLMTALYDLIPCRSTALALISLTEFYDLAELYEAIFRCSAFLQKEELMGVWERAEKVFDPEVLWAWVECYSTDL